MSAKQDLGRRGEDIALAYLQDKGYRIAERNWRYGQAEIDLIMRKADALVFIEVKSRTDNVWGSPESFLTRAQEERIMDAASVYAYDRNHNGPIRFDVIGIMFKDGLGYVEHFDDAFWMQQ